MPGGAPAGAPPVGRRPRAVARAVELAPVALVVVAEAARISVLGGLLQEFALRDPVLGIPALAACVAAGVGLARLLGPRLGDRWPGVGFLLVLAAGALGWLASPAARAALAEGAGPALAAHPAGWLAGLALLRGFAHASLPLAEGTVTNLLAIGVPGLAVAATIGGLIGDPFRTRFLADSLGAAIVYVAGAVLALAFTRLDAVGVDAGFDWRRNPPWLLLTIAMVGAAIVLAIPLASVAGTVISVVVSVALGPLFLLGLATGFDRAARRVLGFFVAVVVVLFVLVRFFGPRADSTETAGAGTGAQPPPSAAEQIVTISLGGLLLLAAVVAIIVLVALWMRRTPPPDGLVGETREIDPSGDGVAPGRPRNRFGRRRDPRTAVEAYVALVADLDRHEAVRRGAAETPAGHAARLRAGRRSELALDLLAADYALARYGGASLPEREDRRAVGRWRILRRRLAVDRDGLRHRVGRSGRPPTPDANLPVDLEPRRTF
jgi:hypothetical protein